MMAGTRRIVDGGRSRSGLVVALALALAALVTGALAGSSSAAPPPPTGAASVSGGPQFVKDGVGVVFTFVVENTGATPIGGVQISRPTDKWKVTACLSQPVNWRTAERNDDRCRFRSLKDPADDIQPGQSATFSLRATTKDAAMDRTGMWEVRLARTDKFDNANSSFAAPQGTGLGAIQYS